MLLVVALFVCNLACGLVSGQAIPPGQNRGPCARENDRLQSTGGTGPGSFVPQCTANGYYNAQQNHASTGYTWCVDPENGQEIPGTKVGPGSTPQCSKCLSDKANALPPPGSVGAYVPKCNSQGNFEVQQVHGSTGYTWCVDPQTGQEISGTRAGPGNSVQCPRCLVEKSSAVRAPGSHTPHCDSKGNFEVLQVHSSTGYSWCVDPESGQEVSGTRVGPGSTAKCPRCLTEKSNNLPAPGGPPTLVAPVAKCDSQGNFALEQSNPSTGYRWCVDPTTGQELPGSRVPPGSSFSCPRCIQEQGPANKAPGSFTPKCDSSGNYNVEQTNPSTGYRWCVDAKTGVERPGSRIAPGEQRNGGFRC